MIHLKLVWHKYRYFPYERELARREAETLFGPVEREDDDGILVAAPASSLRRAALLTYFACVQIDGHEIVPDQAILEMSSSTPRAATRRGQNAHIGLSRQNTRYSAHGLHEYRGKFNPQVVRTIGNILGLDRGARVLDPFCGSGTTLLEGAHIGWDALGLDLNPLAVLIANAKITAFHADPDQLRAETGVLVSAIETACGAQPTAPPTLPNIEYLSRWFTQPVLGDLSRIAATIDAVVAPELRPVFRTVLSDICREVSLQDPGDLRIRRRKVIPTHFPVIDIYSSRLMTSVEAVLAARRAVQPEAAVQEALLADAREPLSGAVQGRDGETMKPFDAAITSPPYATALPYIDTQRLSLCLLGLLDESALRTAERALIGNREIGSASRAAAEAELQENAADLPPAAVMFCRELLEIAAHESHGFRRRNVPALLYWYLADMGSMFCSVRSALRDGADYALVVGTNSTVLRGRRVVIDTPSLLTDVAQSRGWALREAIPLDTYHRYDIHRNNSIRSETLLLLRAENAPHGA